MCDCFPSHAASRSPAEPLKTTSYQMNPQFRLSNFKFKFITEASLMREEDTRLGGLWGPASITIKRNRRRCCGKVGVASARMDANPVKMEYERSGCRWDGLFLVPPLCLWLMV